MTWKITEAFKNIVVYSQQTEKQRNKAFFSKKFFRLLSHSDRNRVGMTKKRSCGIILQRHWYVTCKCITGFISRYFLLAVYRTKCKVLADAINKNTESRIHCAELLKNVSEIPMHKLEIRTTEIKSKRAETTHAIAYDEYRRLWKNRSEKCAIKCIAWFSRTPLWNQNLFVGAAKPDRVLQVINANTQSLIQYAACMAKQAEWNGNPAADNGSTRWMYIT